MLLQILQGLSLKRPLALGDLQSGLYLLHSQPAYKSVVKDSGLAASSDPVSNNTSTLADSDVVKHSVSNSSVHNNCHDHPTVHDFMKCNVLSRLNVVCCGISDLVTFLSIN